MLREAAEEVLALQTAASLEKTVPQRGLRQVAEENEQFGITFEKLRTAVRQLKSGDDDRIGEGRGRRPLLRSSQIEDLRESTLLQEEADMPPRKKTLNAEIALAVKAKHADRNPPCSATSRKYRTEIGAERRPRVIEAKHEQAGKAEERIIKHANVSLFSNYPNNFSFLLLFAITRFFNFPYLLENS